MQIEKYDPAKHGEVHLQVKWEPVLAALLESKSPIVVTLDEGVAENKQREYLRAYAAQQDIRIKTKSLGNRRVWVSL